MFPIISNELFYPFQGQGLVLNCCPAVYAKKHVSNFRPVGQMCPSTAFYLVRESFKYVFMS